MSNENESEEFTEEQPQKVEVTVKKEPLRAEANDQEMQKLFNEMKERLLQRCEVEGVPIKSEDIQDVADLKLATKLYSEFKRKLSIPLGEPKGIAPLTKEQTGQTDFHSQRDLPLECREYDSFESMFQDLERERTDTESPYQKEAEQILRQLYEKGLKKGGSYEYHGKISGFSGTEQQRKEKKRKEARKWKKID